MPEHTNAKVENSHDLRVSKHVLNEVLERSSKKALRATAEPTNGGALPLASSTTWVYSCDDEDWLIEKTLEGVFCSPYAFQAWPASGAYLEALSELSGSVCDAGKSLWDIGAGIGSIALPLAGAGYNVVAFDLDPYALALCQKAAITQGLKIRTQVHDLLSNMNSKMSAASITTLQGSGDKERDPGHLLFCDMFYDEVLADACGELARDALEKGLGISWANPGRVAFSAFMRPILNFLRYKGGAHGFYLIEDDIIYEGVKVSLGWLTKTKNLSLQSERKNEVELS